jgi:acyl-CoA thioester hydrolase
VRWYLALYDDAGDALYQMLGLSEEYLATSGMGGFDLEHHIWYRREVQVGDIVEIRVRFLARSAKLLHYVMFMANETRGVLASMFECVHAHADLSIRRVAPFPPHAAAKMDALIAEHCALAWPAPTSGAMGV